MANGARKSAPNVVFAVMGATGTGKSTFIHLLTNDDTIQIGHNQESETSDIQSADYTDQATGHRVTLIDTPGFDDSREGITDTDILQKIVDYLEPEKGKSRKLNGIIYMHRISDPRLGGVSRKNLRMFQSLCGNKNLANVRIITTNWNRVTEEEGKYREADLRSGAFKPLIDAGAQMRRYVNTIESASHIMSELIPLPEITTAIQEEVRAGKTLAETGAGRVLTEAMREMERKHKQEMAELKEELEMAVEERNEALRAELEPEYRALEAKLQRVEDDRVKLARTLDERREEQRNRRGEEKAELTRLERQWAEERNELTSQIDAARENAARLEKDAARRQAEMERQIADVNRKAADLAGRESATAKAEYERQANMAVEETSRVRAECKALEEKIKRIEVDRAKLERKLDEQREAQQKKEKAALVRLEKQCAEERRELSAQLDAVRENVARLEKDAAKREAEIARQIGDADRKAAAAKAEYKQRVAMAEEESKRAQAEYKALEEKIKRVEADRARVERTLDERREAERKGREEEKAEHVRQGKQWAEERRKLSAQVEAARENTARLEKDAVRREAEIALQIADANRKAAELAGHEKVAAKAAYERQASLAKEESNRARAEYRALEEKIKRVEADRAGVERTLEEQREAEQKGREEENAARARLEMRWAEERRKLSAQVDAARENAARLEKDTSKGEAEMAQQIADANRKAAAAKAEYEQRVAMAEEESNWARAEYEALVEKIKRVEDDQAGRERKLHEQHEAQQKEEKAERARREEQFTEERRKLSAQVDAAHENAARLEKDAAKRQSEIERQITDTNRKVAELRDHERAEYERQANQWTTERNALLAELVTARENATQMAGNAAKKQRELAREISMHRRSNTVEPESIPLDVIPTTNQEGVLAGMNLADTSAGRVPTEEMRGMQKRHEQEMVDLRKELETVAAESNRALRAELELERKVLEEKIQLIEGDRAKLERTVDEAKGEEDEAALTRLEMRWAEERRELSAQVEAARENAARLEKDAAKREEGMVQQIVDANRKAAAATAEHEREANEWASERNKTARESNRSCCLIC